MSEPTAPPPEAPGRGSRVLGFVLLALAVLLLFSLPLGEPAAEQELGELRNAIRAGRIAQLTVGHDDARIEGQWRADADGLADLRPFHSAVPTDELLTALLDDVDRWNQAHPDLPTEVHVRRPANAYLLALIQMLPWLLFGGFLIWLIWRSQRGATGASAHPFGRTSAQPTGPVGEPVTFADVAGIEEAKEEVHEIIEFLRAPERFRRLGGRIPRGVLLIGPPGTGKTLLARAVAGEAGVPFFSMSGSDFVEMFVGVGASRVRDLFRQARDRSPCIIFLDEIDAVGRRRGLSAAGGSEEREQTLNAILVEMDGFESDSGVIVIAASNRPDVLDPALMRPGRFDREITVDLPDMRGRHDILQVHARNVPLADEVDLEAVARGTPGFSGADLEALVNEAALLAALSDLDLVGSEQLEEARDKVRWGRAKKSRVMEEDDRRVTAYHEAGHALLAHLVPEVEPLHKVTIIPRGPSLGSTMQLPERDQYHFSRKQAYGNLMVLLGGRIAEARGCGDICSGASNDLERASELAWRMVCEWGMSERVGPIVYRRPEAVPGDGETGIGALGERLRREIDDEVRRLVTAACRDAEKLIEKNSRHVQAIAEALLCEETLTGSQVEELIGAAPVAV